jgi:hypothetical protein
LRRWGFLSLLFRHFFRLCLFDLTKSTSAVFSWQTHPSNTQVRIRQNRFVSQERPLG